MYFARTVLRNKAFNFLNNNLVRNMAYMLESHSANTCIFNLASNRPNGNRTNTQNLTLNTERPSTRRLSFAFFVLGSCAVQDYIFF